MIVQDIPQANNVCCMLYGHPPIKFKVFSLELSILWLHKYQSKDMQDMKIHIILCEILRMNKMHVCMTCSIFALQNISRIF